MDGLQTEVPLLVTTELERFQLADNLSLEFWVRFCNVFFDDVHRPRYRDLIFARCHLLDNTFTLLMEITSVSTIFWSTIDSHHPR